MAKRNPSAKLRYCDHCRKLIERGEGGMITIPLSLTGYLSITATLHERCLSPYLAETERRRPKRAAQNTQERQA